MYCVFSVARSLISSVRVALRDTSLLKLVRPIYPWIFAKRLRQSTPFRKEEGRNRERELVEVVPVSCESQSNLSAVATKIKKTNIETLNISNLKFDWVPVVEGVLVVQIDWLSTASAKVLLELPSLYQPDDQPE